MKAFATNGCRDDRNSCMISIYFADLSCIMAAYIIHIPLHFTIIMVLSKFNVCLFARWSNCVTSIGLQMHASVFDYLTYTPVLITGNAF